MALRVIVEVENDEVRLVRLDQVSMPAPGVLEPATRGEGLYVELRDGSDAAVYQEPVGSRVDDAVEVFAPDGSPRRVDVTNRKQTVLMVLPEAPGARSLVFTRAHMASGGRRVRSEAEAEPVEIARFELPVGGAS